MRIGSKRIYSFNNSLFTPVCTANVCVCVHDRKSPNWAEKINNISFYLLEHKKGMQDKMMLLFPLTL